MPRVFVVCIRSYLPLTMPREYSLSVLWDNYSSPCPDSTTSLYHKIHTSCKIQDFSRHPRRGAGCLKLSKTCLCNTWTLPYFSLHHGLFVLLSVLQDTYPTCTSCPQTSTIKRPSCSRQGYTEHQFIKKKANRNILSIVINKGKRQIFIAFSNAFL